MPKVHVTDNNEVKSCEASIKDCKYGKIENSHFDDENAAQKEAEKRNTQQYGQFNVQEKPKKIYEDYAPRVVDNARSKSDIEKHKGQR